MLRPGNRTELSPFLPVSILTHSEKRVLPGRLQDDVHGLPVSILTHSEKRVLPSLNARSASLPQFLFQSSPTPRSGCYGFDMRRLRFHECVSILTHSEKRVLHAAALPKPEPGKFQSSPTPRSGCYTTVKGRMMFTRTFQSSPTPRSGCYREVGPDGLSPTGHPLLASPTPGCRLATCFNPHPLREAGATAAATRSRSRPRAFQSSPTPRSGCYLPVAP